MVLSYLALQAIASSVISIFGYVDGIKHLERRPEDKSKVWFMIGLTGFAVMVAGVAIVFVVLLIFLSNAYTSR
jgi:NADH:ubiquinone oxidoreductase subunit 2 (subunit N)